MEAEPYYVGADGKKHDAAIHADMLENNPKADAAFERLCESNRGNSAREAAQTRECPSGLSGSA